MACFNLTNCFTGSIIVSSTNLAAYVGLTITILEQPGECYVVSDNQDPACVGVPVTFVAQFNNCLECHDPPVSPCDCPQGTILVTLPDGTTACQQDSYVLAQGPLGNGCHQNVLGINQTLAGFTPAQWGPSDQYCRYGARFYGETASLQWPISFTTGCAPATQVFTDFSANPVPAIGPNVLNTLWGDGTGGFSGPYTGRYNIAGVTPHPTIPCNDGVSERKGFVHCMNVATTTTYSFGVGAMAPQIIINGIVFLDTVAFTNIDIFGYENWNVFQLTLPPGNYVIQMIGHTAGLDSCATFTFNNPPFNPRNPGSVPGLAFEIYQATTAALAAMTTTIQLNAVLVYSTVNELGGKFDYGSVNNYRCPCTALPPAPCFTAVGNYNLIGPVLDNCTANPLNPNANPLIYVCHTYTYTPITPCCYLLTNCDPAGTPYTLTTSTDLSLEVGNVVTVNGPPGSPPIIGCYIVSVTQCTGAEIPVTVTQSFGPASDGGCAACAPKCYMLEDCSGIIPAFIVSDDLSLYVGQVISLCPPSGSAAARGAIFQTENFTDQIVLTDCCNPNNKVRGTPPGVLHIGYLGATVIIPSLGPNCWVVDSAVSPIGSVATIPSVALNWFDTSIQTKQACDVGCPSCSGVTLVQCGCFIVTLAGGCQGAIPLPGVITNNYITCADCLPKCYKLTDCSDPTNVIITDTDLSLYLTQVIFIDGCPGICWIVTTSDTCVGAIPVVLGELFIDCDTCLGIVPVPLELKPRKIKPGYDTPACDPAYTEKVNCTFSEAVYDAMIIKRYGITMCCNQPIEKWDIKKQLLDLMALYDPELCKNTFCICLPPCALVSEIVIYDPRTCDPPTDMESELEVPSDFCPPPVNMEGSITIP